MAESIFQTLLNRLTDLSSKNKSLYIPKIDGSGFLDLYDFEFLNGEPSFEVIRKLILEKKKISLIPEFDPRLAQTNTLSKSLSRLVFRDQLTQEETGDHALSVAWLFVEGKLVNGQLVRAPILMHSVKIEKEEDSWILKPEGSWQWNSSFLLAYQHAYKVNLEVEKLEEELANFSKDPTVFRTELSKYLQETFAIKLSSSLFEDRIQTFPESKKSTDNSLFQDGKISIKNYSLLGQFVQKGSFLVREYEFLQSQHSEQNLEGLFTINFAGKPLLSEPREDQLFPVFPLDASQEEVLHSVRKGKSLVVEGPPGTGKSQLISNLVSDFIARGKKVLVVSQKRAALDVVYDRMEKAGFGKFMALVHDFRTDQKELFQKIKDQIDSIEKYLEQNRGIDSMFLEREISQHSKTIERLSAKFEDLRESMIDSKSAGLPIKAMYIKSEGIHKNSLKPDSGILKLNWEEAQNFKKEFKIFKSYSEKFGGSFWEHRNSFSKIESHQFATISDSLQALENFSIVDIPDSWNLQMIKEVLQDIIRNGPVSEQLVDVRKAFDSLKNRGLGFDLVRQNVQKGDLQFVREKLNFLHDTTKSLELSLPDSLDAFREEATWLRSKSDSWSFRLLLPWRRKSFPNFAAWLEVNKLKLNVSDLRIALQEFDKLCEAESEIEKLPKIEGFSPSLFSLENDLHEGKEVLRWFNSWNQLTLLSKIIDWSKVEFGTENFSKQLDAISKRLQAFESDLFSWKIYFSNRQIEQILFHNWKVDHPNLYQTFSELTSFDQFSDNWDLNKKKLAQSLIADFSNFTTEEQIQIFDNSWYSCWISELEKRNSLLSEAGSLKLEQEMEELKSAILEKRAIAKDIALLRLREQMSSNLEFNRLGNRLTYRELSHQVSKKRQKWPIRKLVSEIGEEVFRILPCWLASPETVSAIFPYGDFSNGLFDLVIFDEASQCQVERGLPAMLKGKQVVVAGDSKQLRPSDFYQLKWDSEDEGLEYESESLLELAGYYFEKRQLKGHYRSSDPALIHFSNSHFYGNLLETLPDYMITKSNDAAFSWLKVEGIWENQINRMEADAVLELVQRITSNQPEDTIGIVTGNYFQMELIREKLWNAGFQKGVKVRNIENVQGDEFDQVILSLGYALNREGKLVTNFGLLGKSGAENRLNVAISRSRKRMHVITSLDPSDFRESQIKNPGIALLKEFLSFVKSQASSPGIEIPDVSRVGFEFDWSLKNKLLESDASFSNKIPSSVMDLIQISSGFPEIAVLTDDQRFFNAPSAKAAMVYHPILLEQKGWKWEWKWSRSYFFNKLND